MITENIDCDFARVDGYLILGEGWTQDDLEKEFEGDHQNFPAKIKSHDLTFF
jgi:hypothetical protein